MAALKAIMPRLAPLLGTTPTSLYERQRALVGADMLTQSVGKGPGSGVHLNAQTLATLLLSVMATDSLAEAAIKTSNTVQLAACDRKCILTKAINLHGALATLLDERDLLDRVLSIKVSRTANRAVIAFRPHGKSEFGVEVSEMDSMQIEAKLTGKQLRLIMDLVARARWASLAKRIRDDRSRNRSEED